MPFNGAGVFTRIYNWVTDQANGIYVQADRMDTDTDDIATALSNCVTRDGQTPAPILNAPTLLASPPTGDDSLAIPSTRWVNQLSFAAALPAQIGHNDELLSTSAGAASFSPLLKSGTIRFADSADPTKRLAFNLAGFTTLTTRTVIVPDANTTLVGTDTVQTLTNKTLTDCTLDGTNQIGYKNIPQNSKSAAYTTVLADAGKHILHPSADTTARVFTIDSTANVAYPIGTAITFVNQNGAGTITISITADTMRLAGAGTTGSRTLAANGVATAIKIAATEWIISGSGLT